MKIVNLSNMLLIVFWSISDLCEATVEKKKCPKLLLFECSIFLFFLYNYKAYFEDRKFVKNVAFGIFYLKTDR